VSWAVSHCYKDSCRLLSVSLLLPACLRACRVRASHSERIDTFIALQFLFDRFWKELKVGRCSGWCRRVGDGVVGWVGAVGALCVVILLVMVILLAVHAHV
jgi:hypothetical protein